MNRSHRFVAARQSQENLIQMRLAIGQYTATSAVGAGLDSMREAMTTCRSGLRQNDFDHCDLDTWIGRVDGVEAVELPDHVAHLHSRNNQLAWLGLQQGLALLESMPDDDAWNRQEIAFRVALGVPLLRVESPMSQSVRDNYERARVLCEAVGDEERLFPVLWGLWFSSPMASHSTRARS